MLVERIDRDLGAPGHYLGGELAFGVAADPTREDQLDLVGAADVEIVGHRCLEESPGPARGVKDDGATDFDLAHGELPPESGCSIGCAQRGRDKSHPTFEEGRDLVRAEAITDR